MIEFKIGRDFYHRQNEIFNWCEETFGDGCWSSPVKGEFQPHVKASWTMDTIFGYTYIYFKNPEDASMFSLKWFNANGEWSNGTKL